jgi:hypothetical protein
VNAVVWEPSTPGGVSGQDVKFLASCSDDKVMFDAQRREKERKREREKERKREREKERKREREKERKREREAIIFDSVRHGCERERLYVEWFCERKKKKKDRVIVLVFLAYFLQFVCL